MNILLVDDDPEIRLIATHVLLSAGHAVREAEDAATARTQLDGWAPDVLLMDVMLGEEDGVTVARELTAGMRRGQAPLLVFLTGAARPEQVARLEAESPAGIIRKPFDPAAFADTIRRIVQGAS